MEKNKKIILGIVIIVVAIVISAITLTILTSPYYGLDERVEGNFRLYDQNNDGYLAIDDLEYRAESSNMMGTAEDPNVTLQKYDKNNDGKLDLIETHNWMIGNT